jgi:hypothetical protein
LVGSFLVCGLLSLLLAFTGVVVGEDVEKCLRIDDEVDVVKLLFEWFL